MSEEIEAMFSQYIQPYLNRGITESMLKAIAVRFMREPNVVKARVSEKLVKSGQPEQVIQNELARPTEDLLNELSPFNASWSWIQSFMNRNLLS